MKLNILLILFASLFIGILACENNTATDKTSPEKDQEIYISKGKAIAGATFSALSGKLKSAIEEGGVANAVQYCNIAAMPLVDSLSKVHKATIRRTSSKKRYKPGSLCNQ